MDRYNAFGAWADEMMDFCAFVITRILPVFVIIFGIIGGITYMVTPSYPEFVQKCETGDVRGFMEYDTKRCIAHLMATRKEHK